MSTELDANGQPVIIQFNAGYRLERDIAEMLGLAKGVLADGVVNEQEAILIHQWLLAHPDACSVWPGNVLTDRLERIFADRTVTDDEREDLRQLLTQLVGGDAGIVGVQNAATALPFDAPAPEVVFSRGVFVLTGQFATGPRSTCQKLTCTAGGTCEERVTQRTSYLVVGTFGSRDWIQTSHGRKIEKAVEYRSDGRQIAIIGEEHWVASLRAKTA